MRRQGIWVLLGSMLLAAPAAIGAEQAAEAAKEAPQTATAKKKRVLTPEEKKEKELRKACKIRICDIFASRVSEGEDVRCNVVKTWREEDIEEILSGGRIGWPWGKARCTTELKLARKMLAAAMGEEHVAKLEPHTVSCSLDRKSEGQTYDVTLTIAPEVTFRKGRAAKAQINWGDMDAPALAYGVIWPGARLDNNLNVLEGQVVTMINAFMTGKCKEVADELPSRKKAQ